MKTIIWRRYVSVLVMILLNCTFGLTILKAQEKIENRLVNRNDYVTNLTDMINVTPFIYAASNQFVFAANKKSIEYRPNEAPSIGLKLQHKWLGFAFTYGPKRIQDAAKGTSAYYNFLINSYGKKSGFDVYYVSNKGYYIGNKKVMEDLNVTVPYILRPDLETKGVGFNAYYIFNNRKFSYRSSFIQNEIQRKTAGSFLVTLSGSYYAMKADSSVVLDIYHNQIELISQIKSGNFYTAGVLPGYAITLVGLKRFYVTFSLSWGPLYQIQSYTVDKTDMKVSRNLWITRGLGRVSAGYNAPYFYAGFSAVGDNYHIPLGAGNQLQYSVGNLQVFIGTRLKFPKKWKPVSDWMDNMPLLSEPKDK